VYMRNGDPDRAAGFFTKASALDPANKANLTSLAISHLASGHVQTGFQQLEQAAAGNGKAADRVWALLVLETWMKEYRVDLATEPVGLLTAGTLA